MTLQLKQLKIHEPIVSVNCMHWLVFNQTCEMWAQQQQQKCFMYEFLYTHHWYYQLPVLLLVILVCAPTQMYRFFAMDFDVNFSHCSLLAKHSHSVCKSYCMWQTSFSIIFPESETNKSFSFTYFSQFFGVFFRFVFPLNF